MKLLVARVVTKRGERTRRKQRGEVRGLAIFGHMEVISIELRCEQYLGAGTSGSVRSVAVGPDGRRYAVKTVDPPVSAETLAEVHIHAELPPNDSIVRYHFAWIHDQKLRLLMERVDGELWDALDDHSAAVVLDERLAWMHSLLQAVAWLHSHGIAHRDISPWNCFLAAVVESGADKSQRVLKIGDFGLACRVPLGGQRINGMLLDGFAPLDASAVGSLYSAPELGSEDGYDAKQADIFSAGMTLFAIWHGVTNGMNGSEKASLTDYVEQLKATGALPLCWTHAHSMDLAIGRLIERMVSAQPDSRPSASECVDALAKAVEDARRPAVGAVQLRFQSLPPRRPFTRFGLPRRLPSAARIHPLPGAGST